MLLWDGWVHENWGLIYVSVGEGGCLGFDIVFGDVFLGLVIVGVCVGSFVPLFLNNSCFNCIIHVRMFYNS